MIKPNKQPCCICRDHKKGRPFKIRDDIGREFLVTHICNCPYCGRFLAENYNRETEVDNDEQRKTKEP